MIINLQSNATAEIWTAPAASTPPPSGDSIQGEGGEQIYGEGGEALQGE